MAAVRCMKTTDLLVPFSFLFKYVDSRFRRHFRLIGFSIDVILTLPSVTDMLTQYFTDGNRSNLSLSYFIYNMFTILRNEADYAHKMTKLQELFDSVVYIIATHISRDNVTNTPSIVEQDIANSNWIGSQINGASELINTIDKRKELTGKLSTIMSFVHNSTLCDFIILVLEIMKGEIGIEFDSLVFPFLAKDNGYNGYNTNDVVDVSIKNSPLEPGTESLPNTFVRRPVKGISSDITKKKMQNVLSSFVLEQQLKLPECIIINLQHNLFYSNSMEFILSDNSIAKYTLIAVYQEDCDISTYIDSDQHIPALGEYSRLNIIRSNGVSAVRYYNNMKGYSFDKLSYQKIDFVVYYLTSITEERDIFSSLTKQSSYSSAEYITIYPLRLSYLDMFVSNTEASIESILQKFINKLTQITNNDSKQDNTFIGDVKGIDDIKEYATNIKTLMQDMKYTEYSSYGPFIIEQEEYKFDINLLEPSYVSHVIENQKNEIKQELDKLVTSLGIPDLKENVRIYYVHRCFENILYTLAGSKIRSCNSAREAYRLCKNSINDGICYLKQCLEHIGDDTGKQNIVRMNINKLYSGILDRFSTTSTTDQIPDITKKLVFFLTKICNIKDTSYMNRDINQDKNYKIHPKKISDDLKDQLCICLLKSYENTNTQIPQVSYMFEVLYDIFIEGEDVSLLDVKNYKQELKSGKLPSRHLHGMLTFHIVRYKPYVYEVKSNVAHGCLINKDKHTRYNTLPFHDNKIYFTNSHDLINISLRSVDDIWTDIVNTTTINNRSYNTYINDTYALTFCLVFNFVYHWKHNTHKHKENIIQGSLNIIDAIEKLHKNTRENIEYPAIKDICRIFNMGIISKKYIPSNLNDLCVFIGVFIDLQNMLKNRTDKTNENASDVSMMDGYLSGVLNRALRIYGMLIILD